MSQFLAARTQFFHKSFAFRTLFASPPFGEVAPSFCPPMIFSNSPWSLLVWMKNFESPSKKALKKFMNIIVDNIHYLIICKWVSKGKSLQKAIKYVNFVISDNVECVLIFVLFVAIGPSIAADLSPARENLARKSTFRKDSKIHVALPRLIWPFACLSFSVKEERPSHKHVWPTKNRTVSRSNCCNSWVWRHSSDEKLWQSRGKTPSLPETTANLPLKTDAWKMKHTFLGAKGLFQ